MRHCLILLLLIGLTTTSSCKNDDDGTENSITGTWNLANVYGGFIPTNINYDQGEVIWTFNRSNSRLLIQNNIKTTGPEQIYSGPPSGTYNYEILLENQEEVLYIQDERQGVLILESQSLQIDNGLASDGFVTSFER